MRYEYRKSRECKHIWKDEHGNGWGYFSVSAIKNYDTQKSEFFGDINSNGKDISDTLVGADGELGVSKFQVQLSRFERVVGYIPCVDENNQSGYVRIIKKSYRMIWLPFILVALLALVIGGGWFLYNQDKVDLDEAAIAYQMPSGMKNNDPSKIMMPSYGVVAMKAGTRDVMITLLNPEGNPCYFRYIISLKESGKILYESKWIKPGTAIDRVQINEDLSVGTYPIQIKVDTGTLDDPEVPMNNGVIEATLKVEA